MKVTEIRIDRTKSLGNYENIKLGFSAIPEEGEDLVETVDRLKLILDWELNKDERQVRYEAYKKQLELGETNGKTESVERWIEQYEKQRDAVEALGR